jgi:carbon-monoxide dehydrogenase small subunit
MKMQEVSITVNGAQVSARVEPRELLVHFLRDHARMTGTHVGCDTSQCGACTVRIDGRTAKSCTVLAVQAQRHEVTTVEALGTPEAMSPLQQAFMQQHALQCGFCTPGMVFAAQALLDRVPDPSEAQVREALHGNLCRCTGYQNIVQAVLLAARQLREAEPASGAREEAGA